MTLQGHLKSMVYIFLKATVRLSISDQKQPKPYLVPFSHNIHPLQTNRQMDGRRTTTHANSSTFTFLKNSFYHICLLY